MKRRLIVLAIVLITAVMWPVGIYLAATFIVYDFFFEQEDKENAKDIQAEIIVVNQYIDEAREKEYRRRKDAAMKRFMEETKWNTKSYH